MSRVFKLILWELVLLVPGFVYLLTPSRLPQSYHPRWLTIALTVLYAGFLAYWLWIPWRGGWSAVVAALEKRAAQSRMSFSPMRQNMILAIVALLLIGFVVVPILLKSN